MDAYDNSGQLISIKISMWPKLIEWKSDHCE